MQAGVTSAFIFVGAFNVLYMKLTRITNKQPPSTGISSPARRSLMKGMAGLGATLASSSLGPAIAAQTQSHQPGTPRNQFLLTRQVGDLSLHRAVKVDVF